MQRVGLLSGFLIDQIYKTHHLNVNEDLKYVTCLVRYAKNESGYILSTQWSITWYKWIYTKMYSKRV